MTAPLQAVGKSGHLDQLAWALEAVGDTSRLVGSYHAPGVRLVAPGNGSQGASRRGLYARAAGKAALRRVGYLAAGQCVRPTSGTMVALRHGQLALVVRLVRYAPRALDCDNLAAALKPVRDGIAKALGVGDGPGDPVVWLPDQMPGPTGLTVEVYRWTR